MYQPKNRLRVFGVASMDLFASALGAFVILTLVSLPFFMNTDKSDQLEPMVEKYVELYRERETLQQQVAALQQQNEQISIQDMELLLLVDFSNSYANFLDGLEYELRTLTNFWENRNKKINISLILYGDGKTRYPILKANISSQENRRDLSQIVDLLRRIRSETFQQNNQNHLNQDGPEALHLALRHATSFEWTQPKEQRFVFVHYDNLCYPKQMESCETNLRTLNEQVSTVFMKYTHTAISVGREQAMKLAEEGHAAFIDTGQSWTLQIFHHADTAAAPPE